MKKQKSVTRSILLIIAVGIILFSALICLVVNKNLRKGLENNFSTEIQSQASVISAEMEEVLHTSEDIARWVQDTFADTYKEKGYDRTTMNQLAEYAKNNFDAENIVFFNKFGMQISSPRYGVVPKTPTIAEAIKGKETIRYDKTGGKVYGTVILPLKSDDSYFGAVEIRSAVTTQELVDKITSNLNCDITIFDGTERLFTSFENMAGTTIEDASIIERAENGEPTIATIKLNGQQYISYYYPLCDQEGNFLCTIFIGKNLKLASTVAYNIFLPLVFVIFAFSIALLLILIAYIYTKMIRPLKKVNNAIVNLSSGDADLTSRLDTKSNDEFAELSDGVNKFIEKLQQIVRDLHISQEALNEVSKNLGMNAQDSASATAQILANIESVRHQSESQSSAVQNTNAVIDNSSETIKVLTSLIQTQTASIAESSAAIEQMLSNISSVTNSVNKMSDSYKQLSKTVDQGQVKLGSVDEKVQQIADQSKMLIQANSIISQIASETNLLAMNAAIEASHAGAAGKGFSVVADEIRKLAENSSAQSKTISTELKGISASIQDVVALSQDSRTAFSAIVQQLDSTDSIIKEITRAMDEQQVASKQVFESLGTMKNQSADVTEKAQVMVDGFSRVASDMQTVNQISSTILGSMDEMTAGMQQIGNATQNVSDLASQTEDNINTMNTKLNQFKV